MDGQLASTPEPIELCTASYQSLYAKFVPHLRISSSKFAFNHYGSNNRYGLVLQGNSMFIMFKYSLIHYFPTTFHAKVSKNLSIQLRLACNKSDSQTVMQIGKIVTSSIVAKRFPFIVVFSFGKKKNQRGPSPVIMVVEA